MLKKLHLIIFSSLALAFGGALLAPAASAIDVFPECDGRNDAVCRDARAQEPGGSAVGIAQSITSALLWIIGILAVIMIVVGGLKYVISNGDANRIQSAKNTILYAVIGLVVAILGQAIVLFVVDWTT